MATAAVAEEAAQNLEEAAEVVRKINPNTFSIFAAGTLFGFAIGFYFGHKVLREKLRVEAFNESEKQVAKIREAYMAREKPTSPEEIVRERGYSLRVEDEPAVKVIPAQQALEMQAEGKTLVEIATALGVSEHTVRLLLRPIVAPVPVQEPIPRPEQQVYTGWDYKTELANRSPDAPYVIHQDEFNSVTDGTIRDDYRQVAYTYYAGDDVLVDENNRPLPHADLIVGQNNLQFGHGSDDVDVVFVRNEKYKLEMEICRTQDRYDVEVLGRDPDETG